MKLYYKYVCLLILACFLGGEFTFAQEKSADRSEIVMTQKQLDNIIAKLAERKRQQREKIRAIRESANESFYESLKETPLPVVYVVPQNYYQQPYDYRAERSVGNQQQQQSNADLSEFAQQMYKEFDRLNDRIDWIVLNMDQGSSAARTTHSVATDSEGQPMVVYVQQSETGGDRAQNPMVITENLSDQASSTSTPKKEKEVKEVEKETTEAGVNEELANQLQGQIDQLAEKVRVLDELGKAAESDEYKEEVAALNSKIAELEEALEISKNAADEARAAREREAKERAALKELEKQTLTVYFANNSKAVSNSDKVSIADYTKQIKDNQNILTVKLHGFASNTGSALYNNQISFERAEAVKAVLLSNGIKEENIVVLPHGIDSTGDANKARRVEVRISLN